MRDLMVATVNGQTPPCASGGALDRPGRNYQLARDTGSENLCCATSQNHMDQEKEQLIKLAVLCNAKEITEGQFKAKTGLEFYRAWNFYNKACMEAWRDYIKTRRRRIREGRISDEIERRTKILREKIGNPRVIAQKKIPVSIKQMAEMYVRVVRGEMSPDTFLQGFKSRFGPQITAEVNRRKKLENYGWDSIDWEAVEKHPLLSQLLSD